VLFFLWKRFFKRSFDSQRGFINIGPIADLARSGPASLLMVQEKARLDYLAAKETHIGSGTSATFESMLERLLQLQSTNAIVQSLLNEHQLERLVEEETSSEHPIGKSR
jgi:hypothetical protein